LSHLPALTALTPDGLDAAHPPTIVNDHKGYVMADARLGRLFGRRIKNSLWRAVWKDAPARRPVAHAINKKLLI